MVIYRMHSNYMTKLFCKAPVKLFISKQFQLLLYLALSPFTYLSTLRTRTHTFGFLF